MPVREDLTDALIALIPEDGSRISHGEIKAELEQRLGVPLADEELEEAKTLVVAMGAAGKARGPGGGLKAAGIDPPRRAAARPRRNGNGNGTPGRQPWLHGLGGAARARPGQGGDGEEPLGSG